MIRTATATVGACSAPSADSGLTTRSPIPARKESMNNTQEPAGQILGAAIGSADLALRRAALQAELDTVDREIGTDDPYSHPGRFDRGGRLVDMTGQPQNCDDCGAPYRRSWAYLFCTKNPEHWRGCECTAEARWAIEARWGNKPNAEMSRKGGEKKL